MPPHPPVQRIETQGCSVVLRAVDGPEARELFFSCQPPTADGSASAQAEAAYSAILEVLGAADASFASVVCERIFLRDSQADLSAVRAARERVLGANAAHRPATTEIEQPPLDEACRFEVLIQAHVPRRAGASAAVIDTNPSCNCAECARSHGLLLRAGEETQLHAGALCGPGDNAYEQTLAMFGAAEALLQRAGMEFRDVIRTWIHIRDIDRDYDALNRARREFFAARGIEPVPASTGIGGGPAAAEHDLCLGICAVPVADAPTRTVMTSSTLNEAGQYGADFVRGMKSIEANKVALHVSGTASIDEAGRTAHEGDFEAQADRMLVNVAALLKGQGASFDDVVYAITYLKNPADAERLREKFREAGYEGFPNILVAAQVCRPELLCETEALAILPNEGVHA